MKFAVLFPRVGLLCQIAVLMVLSLAGLHPSSVSAAGCSSPFYVAGSTIPTGNQPSALAVGDFNNDGKIDLAVANQFSSDVSILLGRGDGTFQTAVNYAAGTGPSSVLARDLNGDGKLDLVVSDVGSADVWVLLGNGNGTFQNAVFYDLVNTTQDVAAGDLNNDGKVDLVAAMQLNGAVAVLMGVGNGTFNVGNTALVGLDPVAVAMGDFNRDGKLDVAVANASFEDSSFSSVSILIGRGTGAFFNATDFDVGISPRAIAVGDFNGDSKLDLAVANYGFFNGTNFTNSSISILIGTGTGSFQAPVNYTAGEGPNSIVATDINLDGKLDLVVSNFRSMNVSLLSGVGDGTFQPAINYPAGSNPRALTVAKFNADTNIDFAFVDEEGAVTMLATCVISDLGITQTASPNPVQVGSNVTYTLTITNGGFDSAPDVVVTEDFPDVLSIVSVTPSQGSCNNNAGTVTCTIGNMTNGAQATVTIVANAAGSGSISTTGIVSSVVRPDPNLANNKSVLLTSIIPVVGVTSPDPIAMEAGSNLGLFVFTRTGSIGSLSLAYSVSGTAVNGTDYAFLSGVVTIPNGSSSTTITVSPVDDTVPELSETVIVTITPSSAYNIDPANDSATVTIQDNDVYPVSISDATVTEGNSGTTDAIFTVALAAPSSQTVTVNYATANSTAFAGVDYIATNGTVTFPPGATNATITVRVNGDVLSEANELFFVNLSNPVNTIINDGQGQGTILNDDPLPALSINDVTVTEGNSGTTDAFFTLTLSPVSGQTVTVNFATANGTAVAGADYVGTNITVTFPAGTTTQTIGVKVLGEGVNEVNETFVVNLSAPSNAILTDNQGVATINNDDPVPSVSINDVAVTEANSANTSASFTVSLSGASGQTVTLNYVTADGTALAGSDYVATNGTLTFAPGTTTQTIVVTVLPDTINEANETFVVNLSNPVNAIITDPQGTGTINNDDPVPTVSIADVTVTEGNSGTTDAVFTLSLSRASGQALSVNYATANGTATAGNDYISTNGTVTFPPGTTTQSVTVKVIGDVINEVNETFLVNLSNPTNVTIADPQGQGTITNDDPLPSLSINNVTVVETTNGFVNAVFTVDLSAVSGQTVGVSFATASGTATAGVDYVSTNGTLTFPAGTTSRTVTVTIIGDLESEVEETYFVNLSAPVNATINDDQGLGTILNAAPALSVADASITEGNSGTTALVINVSLPTPSSDIITVSYFTANGTAIAGVDYTPTNGVLTFNPGVTNQTVTIGVLGDLLNEANETIFINLTNSTNAVISHGQAVATIINDDPLPGISIGNTTVTEGNSGTVNAVFTASLSAASGQTVTINYSTTDGTASSPNDYLPASGTLTFSPGVTSQTVTVTVNGDLLNEANETFFVNLSNPGNAIITDGQGTGTINNDDPLPSLSVNDVTVTEGNSGNVNATFTVTLSAVSGQAVAVNFATANGGATAGSDFTATNGVLNFAPGTTVQTVTVQVAGDVLNEADETFALSLSNPINAAIGDGQGLGTILNDDPLPALSIADVTVTEGDSGTTTANFTVTLSAPSGRTVTVNYATANGTALSGADYTAVNSTLTFPAGVTTQTIAVGVIGELSNELDENFFVNLNSPSGASITDSQATGMILNDDPLPTLSINDVAINEGNSGTVSAVFTVTVSPVSGQTVTVNYATADGTALAGVDYQATSGSLTFPPGTATRTIAVTVLGDLVNEANDTFVVNLSSPGNATLNDSQGIGTINNDDPLPSISINDVTLSEGNVGTNAVFTVRLSAPSEQTVTVNFATAAGTATANVDYITTNGVVTFPPGNTNQSLAIAVVGDGSNEANETFVVNLSNPVNAIIGDAQGTGTITNDDPPPTISISDAAAFEGNSGTSSMLFTVSLSAPSSLTVTVSYSTADGTAARQSDYVRVNPTTLTFAPGVSTQTVSVTINGDTTVETNETIFVNLSSPVNATLADAQGTGWILNDDGVPSLSINDVTVLEGNAGTTNAIFNVRLSAASSQLVTVNYATADGTATAGSDYVATNGLISFSPGVTNRTIIVPVNGDVLNEVNKSFFVNLSRSTNALISDAQGVCTINNDDPLPTLSINDVSIAEGDSGTTTLNFTVTLSPGSGQTVNVNFATADGTATSGSDYVANSGTLSFAPGVTTRTISVSILGDTLSENNENFFVNLSSPVNATLADVQGIGGINNDDAVPILSITDVSIAEGNAGTANAFFTVSLSEASGQTVTVNYATTNGTALAGIDYVSTNGTLTFPPLVMSQTITVRVNGDLINEADETFLINLSNPLNAIVGDGQAVGTIFNDDPLPNVSVSDVTVTEGNNGTTDAVFTVTLTPTSEQTVTVNFATSDGTAVAGADYVGTNVTVSFAPGTTVQTVAVKVLNELINETDETFLATLNNPTNALLGDSQGVATIRNDDPLPTASISDVTVTEGNAGQMNAVFTVSLSSVSGRTVTIDYATANGNAIAGTDYVGTSGTVTFVPGTPTQTITVMVNGDLLNELDETFFVNLSNPVNATTADGQGLATILNDDGLPGLSIGEATVAEGNSGTSDATFTVSLSAASGQAVTVNYATANGTALSTSDYASTNGNLTFAPGVTSQTIVVKVNGDTLNEANETFLVSLSNPINATIADGQGTGTINNDDPVPSLSINDVTVTEGGVGTSDAIFTVTLSTASGQSVSVNYATASGTAIAGADFISTNGVLTFAPGTLTQTITVKVLGETINEVNETFSVNLSNPINANIADDQGIGTINNDDPLPKLSINDVLVTEVNSGTSDAVFSVSLSVASGQTVTVNYSTADGTAIAGGDYVSTNGTITFSPGTTTQNVTVKVTGDNLNEANEVFFVNLSAPVNATLLDDQGAATINNDDPLPALSINNVTVTEGNTNAVFTVSLATVSGQPVTVSYATANGTAIAGTDFVSTNGTLSFAPGTLTQTITVAVLPDAINEANESFAVNLSNPINATILDGQGTGTINNDDPVPSISINDVTVTEGDSGTVDAVFTLSLSVASGQPLSLNYATANGTALGGVDYITTNGLVTFAPGTTAQTVTVKVIGDLINETNETFFVNLSNPTNATIADVQGVGTINNNDPLPTLSINNVSVTEGNSGTASALFTVSLSDVSGQTVTVNYATANNSAVSGTDYVTTNGSLTFPPGTTTQTITVRVNGDILNEADETFFVNLSAPANATLADGQGTGTISNDDSPPSLTINNATVTEGNSSNTNATFTVTLSVASGQTVTVVYATADGTATAGSDYVAANGTLTFAPGTTTQTIVVPVLPDSINEATETFFVNLSNPNNVIITDGQGVGTINNDDPLPSLTISDTSMVEGDSGTTSALFTVSLSALSGQTVTVNYASSNGTAIAGVDYVATNGTVTFPAGTTNQTIAVAVIADLLNEPNETFFVSLSNASNAIITDSQGRATINNDDPLPGVAITDVSVTEGNSGTVNASFAVTLSEPSGQTVTLNFATANGTATSGSDYSATNGLLTFAAGTVSQTVTVRVNGDLLNETDETFFVNLSNPTNALITSAQGIGTISNDDPIPSLSINNVTVVEGNTSTTNANFAVVLSVASGQPVTVNYATASDTAVAGSDFVSTNGTLTFAAGVTTQTVTVRVTGDLLNEPNESFFVNLSSPTNATIATAQGVGTINNDDALPAITISNVGVVEGDTDSTNALFAVRLSAASGQTVSVNYASANGTAVAGSDYVATNRVVTFAPGTTSQNIEVAVLGDSLNESNETFFVNLSNPINGTITGAQGIGTITNDDPVVSITIHDTSVVEGDSGTTNAVFLVTLSDVSGQTVSVTYATADGTASRMSDYTRIVNTVLSFAPGQTNQTISVPVNGETTVENNETFFVTISSPVNATLADTQATGTIVNDDGIGMISISDVTVTEGNSGTTAVLFNVRLQSTNSQPITVNYATADGTALAGSDYTATNGLVTFAPGVTNQTITVRVTGDLLNEPNETFLVNLSNPTNATLVVTQAVATINNDDTVPTIAINDVTVVEGNSGTTDAVFTVNLSAPSGQTVTVNYATAGGASVPASAGTDYTSTNGTLTFAPGVTSRTVTVNVNGDSLNEANETFVVNLSNPSNATLADGQGVGTIGNDDPVPSAAINDVTVTEGNSGTVSATFTVTLSAVSGQTVSINFATASATATAGVDYTATNGTLTFAPGTTTQTITVAVNGDSFNESDETFVVNLSNPVNVTLSDPQGVGTISNDDAVPSISVNDVTVVEGDSGTTNAVFTLTLSAASGQQISVNYATTNDGANVPASPGTDYIATNGVVTFAAGATTQTITVLVNGDLLNEANETFLVSLSNPVNATLGDAQGTATISNDDALPSISINDVTVTEGNSGTTNALFTVTLSAPSGQTVTVDYASANGGASVPASVGTDYISTNGTLTFTPGTTTQTISVIVTGDLLDEPDESFVVNLSNPTNATLADAQGNGTIANDDLTVSISINDVTVTEGNSGTASATFTISLSAASGQTITVDYATANATASSGSDYVATNGTVTFAPGVTTRTITVLVLGDTLNEANETFFVNLTNPNNATIADNQGAGLINNDDTAPRISIIGVNVNEGDVGTANAILTVNLSAMSGQTVTVDYATANDTATAGTDYISTNGTLTFAPGTLSRTVTVTVLGDLLNEANETFFVNLSNPVNATLTDTQGRATILNDDALPSLSIANVTVDEGDLGATNAVFTVSLSAASGQTVSVGFATTSAGASVPASPGSDYVATNSTLVFAPGTLQQTVTVPVNGDLISEPTETFFVNLTNATNATLSTSQGTGTIVDNDLNALVLSTNQVSVPEGSTNFVTVRLALLPALPVIVSAQFTSGDSDLSVASFQEITFNSNNWNLAQKLVLRAEDDADAIDGQALFTISALGLQNRTLTAIEIDDDDVPQITAIRVEGSDISISFTTGQNRTYQLERTDALSGGSWTSAGNEMAGTGSVMTATDVGGANQGHRFYRIRRSVP